MDPAGQRGEVPGRAGAFWSWCRLLRAQQWSKNVLLFVPALAAHRLDLDTLLPVAVGFAAFSVCVSSGYVFNDLRDLEADRAHPVKRSRPLASGAVGPRAAAISIPVLFVLAFAISVLWLPPAFTGLLALYAVMTLAYSLSLKSQPILDVLVLAGLYTLRVIAGGVVADVTISTWFLAFSMFLFLSLAFLGRFSELERFGALGLEAPAGRGYQPNDLELVRTTGAASGYLAVLVLALYINSEAVQALYGRPQVLWFVGPLLVYWITRMWLLAGRGQMRYDPLVFALRDRPSYLVAALSALVVVLAA